MINVSRTVSFVVLVLIFIAVFAWVSSSATTQNLDGDLLYTLQNPVVLSPEYPDYGSEGWQRNTTGNQKILVIPIMFSDVKNSTTLSDLNRTIKNLTDYYYNVSYGKLNLSYDIIDWITLPKPMAFYGADGGFENTSWKRTDKLNVLYNQLVNDTVKAADLSIDFSKYDHLIIVHAGNNQANDQECNDCIWTMRFPYIGVETNDNCITYTNGVFCAHVDYAVVVSETDSFGVYAHEFGHELGLPDLYDTNNGNSVVGAYELMDLGAWFNAHPGAFSKSKLNFIDEIVIYNETTNQTIFPAENNDTIVKIIRGNPDSWQYYLIEIRKKTGYDANLPLSYPDNALLVWKIDESFSDNQISKHAPMVALNVYNETGNLTDVDGGISINWTLNLNNATLSISQVSENLSPTNRVLDNGIIKPVTCKSLDIYPDWPENDPQTFIFSDNETDYFTLNDNNVTVLVKIIGNVNDTFTFEFINTSNDTNKSYKNISVTVTKNMSRNIYNYWNWFIDPVNVSFKINSSVIGNWSVKILVNGVYTNYSLNWTISDKIDTKPPKVNLLLPQNITENTALILWNASDTGINASGLKEYKIYYYDMNPVFEIYNLTYVIDKKEEIKEFMNRTFYGTLGHTYCFWVEAYDRAGNHNASDTKCVTLPLPIVCNCSTCDECNIQLNNPTCSIVNLITNNITNYSGTCINSLNFSNKIFDCKGHIIDGDDNGTGYGIYLSNKENNTIRNCIITDFLYGIYLNSSSNNTLISNIANNNEHGIYLDYSSNNTMINNIANNNIFGISLYSSSNNIMRNNTMKNNTYNFGIHGWEISDFYQDIDKSNLVDNKPIYYWTNEKNTPNSCKNAVISELNNTGFVALVSCDNITVKNLNLTKNSYGILIVNTTNSKILNNTANNNWNGILLGYSSNNTLTSNTANNNDYGISLYSSSNNTLTSNTAKENNNFDIYFRAYSNLHCNNIIENNTGSGDRTIKYFNHSVNLQNEVLSKLILCNADNSLINNVTISGSDSLENNGLLILRTDNSNFTDITTANNYYGFYLMYSLNNTIINSTANSNRQGILLDHSSDNVLINNNASNNQQHGLYVSVNSTNNTIISNTFCSNNQAGGSYYDIYIIDSNSGDNNTCNDTYNWKDVSASSQCKHQCSISSTDCSCLNCEECKEKLNDPECKVVTLVANITNHSGTCIDFPTNDKIFDCHGHVIEGDGSGYGIALFNEKHNTIKSCILTNFTTGIFLLSSLNNTLINNTLSNCKKGIYMIISSDTTMINNTMTNNTYNFNILGSTQHHYQNIDTSNTVDGKPIYYWTNKNAPNNCKNAEINESTDAGFVALVSCDNITVKNLNLTKNRYGILLVNTTNSKILNDTAKNNSYGICLYYLSSNNILTNNTADNNSDYGIDLYSSSNNTLISNTANNNTWDGIYLYSSSNNTLTNNTANNNKYGIYVLANSNSNKISNNKISNNSQTGITISNCDIPGGWCPGGNSNNTIAKNEISNNKIGIFSNSSNSTINSNYVCGNTLSDFNSTNWLQSSGNNNYCDKANGWNDTATIGCTNTCKATDIFDAVEMLEYLSGDKNLTRGTDYYSLNNDSIINLLDVFALIAQIVIEG